MSTTPKKKSVGPEVPVISGDTPDDYQTPYPARPVTDLTDGPIPPLPPPHDLDKLYGQLQEEDGEEHDPKNIGLDYDSGRM